MMAVRIDGLVISVRLSGGLVLLLTSAATSGTDSSDRGTDAEDGEASGFRNCSRRNTVLNGSVPNSWGKNLFS
jgi:hypothetical protein